MELFPSFSKKEERVSNLDTLYQGSLFHSVEYELSGIVNKINNIDNLNYDEIRNIIIKQHNMILNYDLFLTSNETRQLAQTLFTNKRFLQCFLDVIRLLDITQHEKICLNKLAYDYYILPIDKDEEIYNLLYKLTTEVNGREVVSLSGILGINEARILSMIRNSSFKEEKCIHRVNTYIVKCNLDLDIKSIESIYCFLFHRFTNVFIYTMLESKPSNLSPLENKKFDNISIAILELLNSLPSNDIRKVINDYAFTLKSVKRNTPVRFMLKTALNYNRILTAVRSVEISENIEIE